MHGISLHDAHWPCPKDGARIGRTRATPRPLRHGSRTGITSPVSFGCDTQGRVWALDLDNATELIRQTLILALVVSAPMLLIGLAVGVLVSLLQAVTQIQEQTLSFVPKITAMVASAILLMPWIGNRLMEYSAAMFSTGQLP
jgi:flagellar biosynthetic protein FliQ